MKRCFSIAVAVLAAAACTPEKEVSGEWGLCLDPAGVMTVDSLLGERADSLFSDTIVLPGTTDLAGKGIAAVEPQYGLPVETGRLTRRHSFVGKAWYRKKVVAPYVWREKDLALYLERTKATKLYLDGALVDSCNDVSTPQLYNLGKLRPGVHTITLCVDNGGGVPPQVIRSSHLYSDDTQTNWNGVIGRIEFGPMETFSEKLPVAEMPRLEVVDGRFEAGGKPVFLRGKHDACVFPLTGHTPMDKASWINYFRRCKEYGINHVRFHSWCPPEAAFSAADELGIYLQPELPFWGTLEGEELLAFLRKEGLNIVRTYGHHPSFAMFSLGNELWGEKAVMQELVAAFREAAPQILYTNGTNAFLGWQGYVDGMDFFATCRTRGEAYGAFNTHVRSSFAFCDAMDGGILNHFYPGTTRNFGEALEGVPMPVISHETGQFQSYPDYAQIDKYTGPLAPYNLMEFRRRLDVAGMADQADAFHRASLRWAFELYKADVEMCLRTPGLGGFQLLDIQDYPGQGSAYVGILDAFMDAKGDIDPAEWRQFCSELVPLAEFDKYCWSEDEVFQAHVKVANFTGEDLLEGESEYEIIRPVTELLDGVKAPARIEQAGQARDHHRPEPGQGGAGGAGSGEEGPPDAVGHHQHGGRALPDRLLELSDVQGNLRKQWQARVARHPGHPHGSVAPGVPGIPDRGTYGLAVVPGPEGFPPDDPGRPQGLQADRPGHRQRGAEPSARTPVRVRGGKRQPPGVLFGPGEHVGVSRGPSVLQGRAGLHAFRRIPSHGRAPSGPAGPPLPRKGGGATHHECTKHLL